MGKGQVLETPRLLEPCFLHLVEWEPIQQGRIMLVATYLKELPFEALVRLLEEG